MEKNSYGSLCTEMYEILHPEAPEDELRFYLSYAQKGMRILEPLCGSGRFFLPFWQRGFDICGMDASGEMLERLRKKAPGASVEQADIRAYAAPHPFDYIFIPAGSVSLFTDMGDLLRVLRRMREMLSPGGKFVFAVDTVFDREDDDAAYRTVAAVQTQEGLDLLLKVKNTYEEKSQTQFSPSVYELYREGTLLQRESMGFQTHLYRRGEMEGYLRESGFAKVQVYASAQKAPVLDEACTAFFYVCEA